MWQKFSPWAVYLINGVIWPVLGYSWDHRDGLFWGSACALGLNIFLYFFAETWVMSGYDGPELNGHDPWNVIDACKTLSKRANITTPTIKILNHSSPQCFVVGKSAQRSTLILTTALLQKLNKTERTCVLALAIAKIKNQNMMTLLILASANRLLLHISQSLDYFIFHWILATKRKHDQSILNYLFTYCTAIFLNIIERLTISSETILKVDQSALQLMTGDDSITHTTSSQLLADVLWKLEGYRQSLTFGAPASMAPLFIINPLTKEGWHNYFMRQPSVPVRIKRILGYFPI